MYTPHWERDGNPTATMRREEMFKYYKEHNVAHTCELWLHTAMRDDIRQAVKELWRAVEYGAGKEKREHRDQLQRLSRTIASVMAEDNSVGAEPLQPATIQQSPTAGDEVLRILRNAEMLRASAQDNLRHVAA